jgi:hypothetical protein
MAASMSSVWIATQHTARGGSVRCASIVRRRQA